jgi:hypothetical protein
LVPGQSGVWFVQKRGGNVKVGVKKVCEESLCVEKIERMMVDETSIDG